MDPEVSPVIDDVLAEVETELEGTAGFWLSRGIDPAGGYRSTFDARGIPTNVVGPRMLITQSRLLWTFATLAAVTEDERFRAAVDHGLDWFVDAFWDPTELGWYWSAEPSRRPVDEAKIVYGQSFALYALADCARLTGEATADRYARATFDALQRALDSEHGGYLENLARDWRPEATPSGRRKTLDTHMHLLESLTALAVHTGEELHRRRLREIRELILARMIDRRGVGGNQYAWDFTEELPIIIDRTWIAERLGSRPAEPANQTTSYAHNLEFGWLLGLADDALGDTTHPKLVTAISEYALRFGFDERFGGVYREGPPDSAATDTDKEFWQNAEALIGFLHAYQVTGDQRFFAAFARTWEFARRHLIDQENHEWRIRTKRDGTPVDATLGNAWTAGYHTVRALVECRQRLRALAATAGRSAPRASAAEPATAVPDQPNATGVTR